MSCSARQGTNEQENRCTTHAYDPGFVILQYELIYFKAFILSMFMITLIGYRHYFKKNIHLLEVFAENSFGIFLA